MKILGLIGGIGSGKSTVTRMFVDLGADWIDADRIGHDVLRLPDVKQIIRDRWGSDVFGSDGEVDRKAVARIVFEPSEAGRMELSCLNSLVHPLITREIEHRIRDGRGVLILDAPLLLEAGWDKIVDRLIFVEAPQEIRLQRVQKRGWTENDFRARESTQMSVELKKSRADRIVDNSGNVERTLDQVREIWQNLIEETPNFSPEIYR